MIRAFVENHEADRWLLREKVEVSEEVFELLTQPNWDAETEGTAIEMEGKFFSVEIASASVGHQIYAATLKSLMEHPWTSRRQYRGFVDLKEFAHYLIYGHPLKWNEEASLEVVSHQRALAHIAEQFVAGYQDSPSWEVEVNWSKHEYQLAAKFIAEVMSPMISLGNPESVRLVMWKEMNHGGGID